MTKHTKSGLLQRIKTLFVHKDAQTQEQVVIADAAHSHSHTAENVAFKAGAAVTFITPIGTYAGNHTPASLRKRAEQQFNQMDTTSHTTTMN